MSTPLFERGIIDDNDQTRARFAHLEEISELVGNAYPNKFTRSNVTATPEGEDTITSLVEQFSKHVPDLKAGERPTAKQLETANAELAKAGDVRISGRLATPPRVMGKAAFVHLSDGRERLQIYVRKQEAVALSNDTGREVEEVESGWKLFQLLDHGDFVGVNGFLFVTKTGELSLHVRELQFLSKALLPMPDKMHGISDPEIRQRQRYADLIASSLKVRTDEEEEKQEAEADEKKQRPLTTREVFERRSKLISSMRRYLDEHGYIEVETPMLSPLASGAAARPFKTHHNALDIDLYLRIAPELYLKRLLVGGFERVYELNRNFRNEGISTRHNPEFTMLEFYTAYKDVNWMMDFCEELLKISIKQAVGGLQISFSKEKLVLNPDMSNEDVVINFSEFKRLTMREAIANNLASFMVELIGTDITRWLEDGKNLKILRDFYGWFVIDFHDEYVLERDEEGTPTRFLSEEEVNDLFSRRWEEAKQKYILTESDANEYAIDLVTVFENIAEQKLIQPTFITDFPKVISPLSKASPENPAVAERFELYIMGMEVANGFSELNDPAEQFERFEDQTRQREGGDEEAMRMDEDYVRALAYGMPPAAGIGIGIDRMTMLLTNRRSIRDVILFPHMRPARQSSEEKAAGAEAESSDSKDAV